MNEFYSYYLQGQTLELICKFRYDFANKINIKWHLPNDEVAKNVCSKYLKKWSVIISRVSYSLQDNRIEIIPPKIERNENYQIKKYLAVARLIVRNLDEMKDQGYYHCHCSNDDSNDDFGEDELQKDPVMVFRKWPALVKLNKNISNRNTFWKYSML